MINTLGSIRELSCHWQLTPYHLALRHCTLHLPAAFGDDHLGAEFVELLPQVLAFQRDLGVVDDAVVLRLDGAQRTHHGGVVVVRGGGRCGGGEHHVFGSRVGVAVRPDEWAGVEGRRERVAGVRWRRGGASGRTAARGQQRADAEVCRSLKQEGRRRVVSHLVGRRVRGAARWRRGAAGHHVGLLEPHGCRWRRHFESRI